MKKVLIAALAIVSLQNIQAQEEAFSKSNEVKINFLNTIAIASVEVGYERFFGGDQSVELGVFINDRFSYNSESTFSEYVSVGQNNYSYQKVTPTFKTSSVALSYNFYFSEKKNGSGYHITPFFKYRFGDYEKQIDTYSDDSYTNVVASRKDIINMSSPIMGLGMGYKWLWNEKLAMSTNFNIARNFSKEVDKEFASVEANLSVSVGYRF